jgi:hypothetical protein
MCNPSSASAGGMEKALFRQDSEGGAGRMQKEQASWRFLATPIDMAVASASGRSSLSSQANHTPLGHNTNNRSRDAMEACSPVRRARA